MKVLVLGASANPLRVSNRVTKLLLAEGHNVVAVGRSKAKIDSIEIQEAIPDDHDFDVITLYINPGIQPDYYDTIVNMRPSKVIFNPGTENDEFIRILVKSGIQWEAACNLVLLRTGQFEEVLQ